MLTQAFFLMYGASCVRINEAATFYGNRDPFALLRQDLLQIEREPRESLPGADKISTYGQWMHV